MAAMSTAQTATTLTPPSSSHGDVNGFQWDFQTTAGKPENRHYENKSSFKHDAHTTNGTYRAPLATQNGNAAYFHDTSARNGERTFVNEQGALSQSYSNEPTIDNMVDGSLDPDDGRPGRESQKRGTEGLSDEESKWIHRDKLAKIESEELQAAGIILPHPRSRSRPRRERSQSSNKRLGADSSLKSRQDSPHTLDPKTPDAAAGITEWDDADGPSRPNTGSRIPIPKKSPGLPPTTRAREDSPEELDKRLDAPKARSRSNSTTLKSLEPSPTFKSQPTKRAATDISPKKTSQSNGPRKTSAPAKSTIPPEARGKPKAKGKASTSNARPSTRSGERELSTGSLGPKQMEGEPPWMISAYKPDPRLPPDQQLLPTVAKRLAQEKWEQEGKFGNIYDKDFRPLTDEGFLAPPVGGIRTSSGGDDIVQQEAEAPDEWPLKSPEPKSPVSIGRSSTYSTMPKILDKPPSQSPLASPQSPRSPNPPSQAFPPPTQPTHITRVPDVEEKEVDAKAAKKKGGCGCCIVM